MLYAILCYANEETVFSWTKEEEDAVMAKLYAVQAPLAERGKLGPVGRLMPTTAATTVRKGKNRSFSTVPLRKRRKRSSAFTWLISIRWRRRSPSPRSSPQSIRVRPPTKFGRSTCSGRETLRHDRHCLDRCDACFGPTEGAWRAAPCRDRRQRRLCDGWRRAPEGGGI